MLLTNKGETKKPLAILNHLMSHGSAHITLVGQIQLNLAAGCDIVLVGSVGLEVRPLNLAPTASTVVSIGYALATVWMEPESHKQTSPLTTPPAHSVASSRSPWPI